MKPIPVHTAKIAQDFGYDQVIVVARRVGGPPEDQGEHVTTYGVDKDNCQAAARIGDFLKFKVMGWHRENTVDHHKDELDHALDVYRTTDARSVGLSFEDCLEFVRAVDLEADKRRLKDWLEHPRFTKEGPSDDS